MKSYSFITLQFIFSVIGTSLSFSQVNNDNLYWSEHKVNINSRMTLDIPTLKAKLYNLNFSALQSKLSEANGSTTTLDIPMANNRFETFQLKPVEVMSPALVAKYPEIKTFEAVNLDGTVSGRFDITHKGFHGMMFTPEGTMYIDPVNMDNKNVYQCYHKSDFEAYSKIDIANDQRINLDKAAINPVNGRKDLNSRSSGTQLRTYRMAITATGEYTTFHGGAVVDALAAIVTTMNRVNGIYEREVAIRMVLVGNTDLLIYTDPNTDPYNNDDPTLYIDEVQANIDIVIGDSNYDIGHGFSTGAGGLAGAGPCITGRKAEGVTGTLNPIGDPYDVDYVAHEIGHQFSANHTFNGTSGSCDGNRNISTAYEPGSGSTILAYAGICSPQNIQNNSDPYFHTASYDEILAYSVDGSGSGCASISNTGNNPPQINAGVGGFSIPINTPFKLTGSGVDPDGQNLTFSWEQLDLGPAGDPNSPSGNAPHFRSFSPKNDSSRVFPDLNDIINNTQTIGEILPSYARSLTFRLTARDNQNGGGGVDYDELSFNVTDQAGPFVVTSFNTTTALTAQNNVDVTWDVANTNLSPINCQSVNILLSVDGGFTYPHILISKTNNDGAESVLLPNVLSSTARIMVEADSNVFFDINNANINIVPTTNPPSNLIANIISDGQVDLNWTDNSGDEIGFSIERSMNSNTAFIEIGSVAADVTYYSDITVSSTDNYYYRINAKGSGAFNYSNEEFVLIIPLTPIDFKIDSVNSTQISLTWVDNNTSKDGFVLERSIESGPFEPLVNLDANKTSYIDTLLSPITTYNYRIKTVLGIKESKYSAEVSATTLPLPPSSPTQLNLDLVSITQVNLSWVDNADNETEFIIERSISDNTNYQELTRVGANTIVFSDSTLIELGAYFYRLKAINISGASDYSNEASISTLVLSVDTDKNQIIIYPNPSNGVFVIKFNSQIDPSKIIINVFDMVGNEQRITPLVNADNLTISVDLSQKSVGIYYLHINNDNYSLSRKLLKQ
jgi:hypothetical protein